MYTKAVKTGLIILVLFFATVQGQYLKAFEVLPIDKALLDQTETAIVDLKNALYANFDCTVRNSQTQTRWFGNRLLFGAARQESDSGLGGRSSSWGNQDDDFKHYNFKSLGGFDGFNSKLPQITCKSGDRGSTFYGLYNKVRTVS